MSKEKIPAVKIVFPGHQILLPDGQQIIQNALAKSLISHAPFWILNISDDNGKVRQLILNPNQILFIDIPELKPAGEMDA